VDVGGGCQVEETQAAGARWMRRSGGRQVEATLAAGH
jgi:hypothetical protein